MFISDARRSDCVDKGIYRDTAVWTHTLFPRSPPPLVKVYEIVLLHKSHCSLSIMASFRNIYDGSILRTPESRLYDIENHDEKAGWNLLMHDMITQMMFVSGEEAEPSVQTTTIIEEIVREQVVELVSWPHI